MFIIRRLKMINIYCFEDGSEDGIESAKTKKLSQ